MANGTDLSAIASQDAPDVSDASQEEYEVLGVILELQILPRSRIDNRDESGRLHSTWDNDNPHKSDAIGASAKTAIAASKGTSAVAQ